MDRICARVIFAVHPDGKKVFFATRYDGEATRFGFISETKPEKSIRWIRLQIEDPE